MTESELQSAILATLPKLGCGIWWRNAQLRRGRLSGGLGTGSADLVGIVHMPSGTGRFAALEIKSPRGKASPEQMAWAGTVQHFGGFACVVRSVREAIDAVTRCRAGAIE